MISKPSTVITSLGRTGTRYFAETLSSICENATVIHEPDIFQFSFAKGKGFKFLLSQIKESGLKWLVFRKLFGSWSLVELSDARFTGRLNDEETLGELISQRCEFVRSRTGSRYIESSSGYYGLLDLIDKVYADAKCVYIVRDGRTWVRSYMNWGELYGKGRVRSILAHNWPKADQLDSDPCNTSWKGFSRFQKCCWAWDRLNRYALACADKTDIKVVRYEDLFQPDNPSALRKLLSWILPDESDKISENLVSELQSRRVHKSTGEFPEWKDWTPEDRAFFSQICGDLMDRLGYEYD